ncbi:MAG: hypothetical protein FD167_875 [bacterium]|nr:MAG: hypothetical protein FD167_875 [bacterium]
MTLYLTYQVIINKQAYNFFITSKQLFILLAITIAMLLVIVLNTLSSLYIIVSLAITVFFVYNYRTQLFFRALLPYGILLFISLSCLLKETFFLDNKALKVASLVLIGIFLAICFKSFTNLYRIFSIAIGIFCTSLALLQIVSKIDTIYYLLFLAICLFMTYLAREEKFIWPLLLIFSLIQFPVYSNLPLIKSLSLSTLFTSISLLAIFILFYYIYKQFIINNQSSLLTKTELISSILPHLALALALVGRGLTRNPIRNDLGKVSFILLLVSLINYFIFPLRKEHKIYLLYISILALSVATFEPLQLLLVSSIIFFQIWFTKQFASQIKNHSIFLIIIYLTISFITYYYAYGNLSLSSFFEEGRYPILGGQITDYSYWNLTVIISFLTSKLIIVESIGLLILTESTREINSIARLVVGIFSLGIIILIAVICAYYQPGNQQFLSNISSSLLFIGIKIIIFSLTLLLINLMHISVKEVISEQEIPAQRANLVA